MRVESSCRVSYVVYYETELELCAELRRLSAIPSWLFKLCEAILSTPQEAVRQISKCQF